MLSEVDSRSHASSREKVETNGDIRYASAVSAMSSAARRAGCAARRHRSCAWCLLRRCAQPEINTGKGILSAHHLPLLKRSGRRDLVPGPPLSALKGSGGTEKIRIRLFLLFDEKVTELLQPTRNANAHVVPA